MLEAEGNALLQRERRSSVSHMSGRKAHSIIQLCHRGVDHSTPGHKRISLIYIAVVEALKRTFNGPRLFQHAIH